MKRFDTIRTNGTIEVIDYELPDVQYDISLTDKSKFIPTDEAIKRLTGQALSASEVEQNYDFVDGKDTGMKVPVGRMKGLDIAEVSTAVRAEQAEIKADIAKAKRAKDFKASLDAVETKPIPIPVSNVMSESSGVSK